MSVPYEDDEVGRSSCYVMPVMLEDPELREAIRARHAGGARGADERAVSRHPRVHARTKARASLPRAEHAARAQLTLPLYPHLGEERQDVVLDALADALG